MNKQFTGLMLSMALMLPNILCAFVQEKNGIVLNVTDYAQDQFTPLGYTPNGPITGQAFAQKGIRVIQVEVENKTNKPIMISSRSVPHLRCVDHKKVQDMFQGEHVYTISVGMDAFLAWLTIRVAEEVIKFPTRYIPLPIWIATATYYYKHAYNTKESLEKALKGLFASQSLPYPEKIEPGKKVSQFILVDNGFGGSESFTFGVFDEKHQEQVAEFNV